MDDTRFILDFLSGLEKDLRKIGLSSIIDLHVKQNDMVLESPKTLGVMYVDDIPMYILTSYGRVRLLNDRHHLKMMDKKILQELKDLFFLSIMLVLVVINLILRRFIVLRKYLKNWII